MHHKSVNFSRFLHQHGKLGQSHIIVGLGIHGNSFSGNIFLSVQKTLSMPEHNKNISFSRIIGFRPFGKIGDISPISHIFIFRLPDYIRFKGFQMRIIYVFPVIGFQEFRSLFVYILMIRPVSHCHSKGGCKLGIVIIFNRHSRFSHYINFIGGTDFFHLKKLT